MTREYQQRARADAQAERRTRILDAAIGLIRELPYEELTLARVAETAGVSLATVVRLFTSKDRLLLAAVSLNAPRENRARAVAVGDVEAVARVLVERYELTLHQVAGWDELARRYPEVDAAFDVARRSHLEWLAEVFGPWLPDEGEVRQRRLMALFAVTELREHVTRRLRFGLDAAASEAVVRESLQALVRAWEV